MYTPIFDSKNCGKPIIIGFTAVFYNLKRSYILLLFLLSFANYLFHVDVSYNFIICTKTEGFM